jgi:hypothetical protein
VGRVLAAQVGDVGEGEAEGGLDEEVWAYFGSTANSQCSRSSPLRSIIILYEKLCDEVMASVILMSWTSFKPQPHLISKKEGKHSLTPAAASP